MNTWVIPTLALVQCGLSMMLFLRDLEIHPLADSPESGKKTAMPVLLYSGIMTVLTVGIAVFLIVKYPKMDTFTAAKRVLLLGVLWPVAFIDLKTYRIPNAFVLFGFASRILLIPFELLFHMQNFRVDILSELIAAAALFLSAVLCGLCMPGAIGAGDMKLFLVLGVMLGLEAIWSVMFTSLLISFFMASFLLATKRKGRKDVIPFGPAIVLGTYISVCLIGG